MPKQVFFKQNHGHLPPNPPNYFGPIAAACWRVCASDTLTALMAAKISS